MSPNGCKGPSRPIQDVPSGAPKRLHAIVSRGNDLGRPCARVVGRLGWGRIAASPTGTRSQDGPPLRRQWHEADPGRVERPVPDSTHGVESASGPNPRRTALPLPPAVKASRTGAGAMMFRSVEPTIRQVYLERRDGPRARQHGRGRPTFSWEWRPDGHLDSTTVRVSGRTP